MIIINGASRGIGKYLLDKYFNLGFEVFGTYNNTTPTSQHNNYFKVDVKDTAAIERFISSVAEKLSEITLINCTGINYNSFAHKANFEEWINVIDINLIGTFKFISLILPFMRKQNYGRIINLSSVVSQKGVPGTSAYATSKAALLGLAKSVASENPLKNITINNLTLGYYNIGMIFDIPEDYRAKILEQIPTHAFGEPSQIFNACEFLRNTNYINGSTIDISAGLV